MRGFDDEIALKFTLNVQHLEGHETMIVVKGLTICLGKDLIIRITTLSNGIKWSKEERHEVIIAKRGFSSLMNSLNKIRMG